MLERGRKEGRKVGRTNPGVHVLGSYTDGYTPPFSLASFRFAVIRGPREAHVPNRSPRFLPVFARRHVSREA